jgi:hypothetical protein
VGEGRLGLLTFFRRAAYLVGEQRMSLDDIEHGILRGNRGHPFLPGPQFASRDARLAWVLPLDARLHFALNCASRSCPPIRVYTAEKLDAQLAMAANSFVDSDLRLEPGVRTMFLSSIFKWFLKDFGGRSGIAAFLLAHLPADERREWVINNRDKLRFKYEPYDWGLNIG